MSADPTFHLLATRRFLPLFVCQFLGAANDNVFKNAMVILIIYKLGEQSPLAPQIMVTLAAGLFILPFFLFSATAGQIADRFEKSGLVRIIKGLELGIALLSGWSLSSESLPGLLSVLFLFGMHSTFFGPIKYAVLPEHLKARELIGGNALIEGGTFLAILFGTITGGVLIMAEGGTRLIASIVLALAAGGFLSSLFMPKAHAGNPEVAVRPNILAETFKVLGMIRTKRAIFLSVMGISWFWLIGATYLAQFPAFAKDVLRADAHSVTLMLTVFSVGIGLGSVLCGRWLKGEISARHVPFAALGMTIFAIDLWAVSKGIPERAGLIGLNEFLAHPSSWRVLADLLLMAVSGGIYIVPLYTILQSEAGEKERARMVAANNIMNSAFMVLSAAAGAGMLAMGFAVTEVFLAAALANLLVAVYICGLLPDAVFKGLFAWLFRRLYRVELRGMEHFAAAGERAVVVVNHVSFLDAALMAAFMPKKPTFAINTFIARLWWVRPFLSVIDAYPMDPTNPMSTKGLINAVREGRTCVIFPEGRITVTGALMKIYEGPGMIADRAEADIVPVRIDGAQYTPFSRLKGKVRLRWFPKITITVLPPRRFSLPEDVKGRERRRRIGMELYDVMSSMMFETSERGKTLFSAFLDARRIHGGSAQVLEDVNRKPLSYDRALTGALALGRTVIRKTRVKRGEAVGLLLPNAAATAVAFLALQSKGRLPAMLNFTVGAANVLAACEAARIRHVLTSRRFIEQARLGPLAEAISAKVELHYLEDFKERMSLFDKLGGLLGRPFAGSIERRTRRKPDDPAVVLFTSGSEGTPKGVVLSHANLLSNCQQMAARVAFSPTDIVFNALPVFHSFGLTGGLLLPMLSGLKCFLYPSPLHYRIVPEMVYDTNSTILFGTDTFLSGYARSASAYDFYSLRHVFAGAEKVKDETRRTWMEKFGLRIMEGYGATETSPVISVNTPMHFKPGTVGRPLPGIEIRLEPMPGIEDGKRLWVRGPNVMLGYWRSEKPGQLETPVNSWYDTGDIVDVDAEGYIRIVGRAKRFAKVAGEMVPLGKVESEIAALWPAGQHAAVALPDERKGEQIILVTDRQEARRDEILAFFRERGLSEIMVPKSILKVDRIPLLGTGKTDYVALKLLAESFVRPSASHPGVA